MSEQWGPDPMMPRNDVVDVVGQQIVYPPVPARRVPEATVTRELHLTDEDVERIAERVIELYYRARWDTCWYRARPENADACVAECQEGRACIVRTQDGQRMVV